MNILLVLGLYSPFQVELGRALNRLPGTAAFFAFTRQASANRGSHWFEPACLEPWVHGGPRDGAPPPDDLDALHRFTAGVKPEVVLCGKIRGPAWRVATWLARSQRVPLGFWLEQPLPRRSWASRGIRNIEYRWRLRLARFILGIGDRAVRYYRRFTSAVELVPYGQDLSGCFAHPREEHPEVGIRFVFSGALVPRHNLRVLANAFLQVSRTVAGRNATLVLSGSGPESRHFDRMLSDHPELIGRVQRFREFASWPDRLGPLRSADVLVYPSSHSGWGLVVPEALALGLPVITTPYVEAARYYVTHGSNGWLIEPRIASLMAVMAETVARPDCLNALRPAARAAATRGDAPNVARTMRESVDRLLG